MTKQEVQAILDRFPEQVDTEQLMAELYLKAKLDRAEALSRAVKSFRRRRLSNGVDNGSSRLGV
jgi:hypothetical protein